MEWATATAAATAEQAYHDALSQFQIANERLTTAQSQPFRQLNFQQQTAVIQEGINALSAWWTDCNNAMAAIRDVALNARLCSGDSVIQSAASQAQAVAAYFTAPNILLAVATMNQAFMISSRPTTQLPNSSRASLPRARRSQAS